MARKPPVLRVVGVVLTLFSLIAAVALCLTGYAGCVSPLSHSSYWGILPFCFPVVVVVAAVLLIVQCFVNRKGALIVLAGIAASAGPLLAWCPLHFFEDKPGKGEEVLSLLSYNVLGFTGNGLDMGDTNPALSYILADSADVVCLQEVVSFRGYNTHISDAQRDSLHALYPYSVHAGRRQVILSKYPSEPIELDAANDNFRGADIAAARITLPDGRLVTVFNVHLCSFGLDADDKELYRNLTELHSEPLEDVRRQLVGKLRVAAVARARQVQQLLKWIRTYGGPDVIVAGDFNDVPGSYAIRALADAGFADAYPRAGLGPTVTFNRDRFWFCIDHVLTRGDMRPFAVRKGTLRASDHYPLTVWLALPSRRR